MSSVSLDKRCKLVYEEETGVKKGIPQIKITTKEVYCAVKSVNSSEFTACNKLGIKPALTLYIRSEQYEGAVGVIYNGKSYSIYRKYNEYGKNLAELYLKRKEGVEYGDA